MDSPINNMIDRAGNRKVASSIKAKAKRTKALNDQVLSLVHEANATALPERHVTPRAALIVMARAMKELSSLPEESRTHGVLREVTKFISLNQKTLLASASIKHVDLLPKGHPLSPLNASLTEDDLRKKYAEWIAADPAIADEARPLVAMAHSLPPESIEREHAFLRLRTLQASVVPAYFKIDDVTAITAAFMNGNSSAARRARVALQWRDRFGQWIEMGRGVNFRFRMPDGSVATGKGNYVGAGSNPIVKRTSSGVSLTSDSGLIEVSGVPGLAPGLYAINSKNAAAYQARIPGFEAPQAPSFDDQFDADIPSIEDLKAARKDLPIGWKKQGPYFVSDDNYAVIPGPNGQPQSVTRLNADGRPAATVGNARNWSEVNDLIDKDQPSFDKEIARIEAEGEEGQLPLARIPGATEEDVVDFDEIVNMQKKRAEENKKFEAARPAAKPLGDKDLNGNVVPNSWTRDANDDKAYTRQMPLRDGGTYPLSARVTEDGKYIAGHAAGWIPEAGTDGRGPSRKFESWKEIESSIPEFVDYLNEGFTKDNPIIADRYSVDKLEDRDAEMFYFDKDGNKISGPAPQTEPLTPEEVKKAEQDLRKNMEKNLPPREFPQEPRDDRYDARIVNNDLVEIDKSTLDALNKRMREDSTGEYNMEGVTFAPDNYGNVVMYPDGWTPGDKVIGRIEDDGGIDWESDEQYDKYAEKVAEALRGLGDGPGEPPTDGPDESSGPYGSDFTDMVVDGAESQNMMDRELEEMLDNEDAAQTGVEFANLMWDSADDRFDLQDQFDANRPLDLDKNAFIEAAVEAFNKDVNANIESAIEERLSNDIDYDRNSFDADAFRAAAERRYRERLEGLFFYDEDEGPDEEPPSPGGGTPPKAPSPSTPGSPALFEDFDVPAGAFQLRTTEYEPEGRIDEASTDFTDDPRRLATKFTLDDLVTAFTEALIGRPSDEALQDILDANVGDDDDLPDLDDLGDVANSPAPRAGEVAGTGAGALEFNAGEEYVQAEALYNAVYEAGGDPNRVIANAYDAVTGNRNNARKLLEAQGGVPSQEESQLIEDMTDEIRQIKDVTPEDDEISASQKRDKPEEKFKGELIENVPVDFNNPDYFDMDTDAYIPSVPEIDENGYTDNPEILALDYESTDLIEQMIEGITDGSGVALLDFGGEQGVGEVPVEALRDALQLQAYNTNKILFDLRDESNDMSEEDEPKAAPETPAPTSSQPSVEFAPFSDALANLDEEDPSISPEIILSLDEAANSLVEMFSNGIPADARLIAYNSANGMLVVQTPGTDIQEESIITFHPNGGVMRVQSNPDWFLDGGGIYGWKPMPDEIDQAIRQENAKRFSQETAPESPAEPEAPASPFVYPGPREAGYSVNNTTLASDGSIVGAGSIVTANRDGKRGMVVSIQNDPEYVRIKFDDGKVAVRSANQIKAVSNPDGSLATAPSGALAPSAPSPATDVRERLEAPLRDAPNIARPGSAWGINDASTTPEEIAPFTQKDVPQSKFKAWRSRDAEIAKAANTRASFESLFEAAQAALIARDDRSADYPQLMDKFSALIKDAYGSRDDLTFGADRYKVSVNNVSLGYGSGDIRDGNVTYQMHVRFDVLGENGAVVGEGSRYISSIVRKNSDGTTSHTSYVKNDILKIFGTNQKKGFATAYNRHMENWYIANGVEKVKVLAYGGGAEWKGGFVWALNGFNWESGSSALSVARAIERAANTPQEKELAARLRERVSMAAGDLSQMPLPIEMALIGWYNGADKWLGKEVMTNVSWEGVKHLDPGATEQLYSANYDQIKSAERRVRAGQNKANVSSVGLVQIMDNQFQDSNPELLPHMEQIRDALRNNRPLGFLSPAAKAALNSYVSKQLLDKDSKMPMDDLFRLRNALDAEYRADYDFADPFAGVNEELTRFSLDDFLNNSDALKQAGFASFQLSDYEAGQNTTFRVIHKESGQVFFVKEEHLSQEWNGERGLTNEVEANILLNALGLHGVPDVRGSLENPDIFIMSQAGATIPLTAAPVNAEKMFYRGIVDPNGKAADYADGSFVAAMSNPEDLLSMALIDIIGDSEDRHDGNWMVAFDSTTGKMRIFPIDHGLIRISEDSDSTTPRHLNSAGEVYQKAVPWLLALAGEDRTREIFLNQINKLIKNLDDPLFQPRGESLGALIEKWGSYDAFKDAMKRRLTRMLDTGTTEHDEINTIMKKSYWR